MPRYLFGPVTVAFADQNLHQARASGECLTFGPQGPDLVCQPDETWDKLQARLPKGWCPEFIVLWLPYTHIPEFLWSAPIPIVGLAADWNLLWHEYRQVLPRGDTVFTDAPGVEVMKRAGLHHVRAANLFGLERAFLEESRDVVRDIDICFVGEIVPFDYQQAALVSSLFAQTQAHGLPFCARACLALGKTLDVPVLTADPAWLKLNLGVKVEVIQNNPAIIRET